MATEPPPPDHAAGMAARGFPPRRWTDPPGQCWRDLSDPRDELVIVLKGSLRVWLGDVAHDLGPGDELLVPAGVVHGSEVLGTEAVELLFGCRETPVGDSTMAGTNPPMMTSRHRVRAAIAGEHVDRLPVTLSYQQLVIEDQFCALTGRPEHERIRWLHGDAGEHARILRGIVEDLGCDVVLARHWAPSRAERDDRSVVQRDGRWWLHHRRDDRWDEISGHPGHSRDYAANEICHVHTQAEIDARTPLWRAEDRLASGCLDYARATIAACGSRHYVITGGLEGVVYRCSDHFGLTNLFYAMKDEPELVDHCCRRIHANHLEAIRAFAACGGDAIYIDDATATSDMISKRDYERFSLPYLREQVAMARSLGLQVWLIYFGAIADRLELIADTGADVLMPECSMKGFVNDIGDFARRVGHRITLASNIDPVAMIQDADDATLDAEIRRQVEALRPARGAILSSASPVTPATSPARLRHFLKRCRMLGASERG